MKKLILAAIAIIMLGAAPTAPLRAQAANANTSEAEAKAALAISQGILSVIVDLAKDFKELKGELVTTTAEGTSVYKVKGMEQMQAAEQYIAVRKDGVGLYMATYKGSSDADVRKLAASFAAFAVGMLTVTGASAEASITTEQDKELSVGKTLVYIMKLKGNKVGKYTMDAEKKEGTMVIAFL